MCVLSHLSHVRFFATPRTVAHQAPLSKGFSRQEYWSELPCPPPGDLLDPGFKPVSLPSLASAGGFFTSSDTWRVRHCEHGRWGEGVAGILISTPVPVFSSFVNQTFAQINQDLDLGHGILGASLYSKGREKDIPHPTPTHNARRAALQWRGPLS